ncbi:hypothetical protein OIE91_11550 [Streptomyces albidoflavus]|uniref:hypothetical protein n=1 Tax=Streptomyces albidoflavus TaxID=1886 RepID=UPI00352C64C6
MSRYRARTAHAAAAAAARAQRGEWIAVGVYAQPLVAGLTARRISSAHPTLRPYRPAGAFEAQALLTGSGDAVVWVRYVAGKGPVPAAPPPRIDTPVLATDRDTDAAAAREAAEIGALARLRAERALTHPAKCPCDACRVARKAARRIKEDVR